MDLVEVELVELLVDGARAGVLRLNRPDALNAISWSMVTAIGGVLADLDRNPTVRTILVTGNGRAFSAGGDLKAYLELQRDPIGFPRFIDELLAVFGSIRSLSKPVIALVNGVTVAGGLELMLACDFAFAAESARIGDGHLNYGQMGGGGALSLLPRMIGPARARELMFSARLLDSGEALAWGLVNRVVPDDELLATGIAFAADVAAKSPTAVAYAKQVMNAGFADGTGLDTSLRLERERASLYCLTLPDSREGLAAFAEKRSPRFPPAPSV
jgi:enoyl-CoA hydratase/carnithine racemase